jgi:hypothetical protein
VANSSGVISNYNNNASMTNAMVSNSNIMNGLYTGKANANDRTSGRDRGDSHRGRSSTANGSNKKRSSTNGVNNGAVV